MNAEQFGNTLEGIGFTKLRVDSVESVYYLWGTKEDGIFISVSRTDRKCFSYWAATHGGRRERSIDLSDFRRELGAIVMAISEIVNSPARRPHLPIGAMAHNDL